MLEEQNLSCICVLFGAWKLVESYQVLDLRDGQRCFWRRRAHFALKESIKCFLLKKSLMNIGNHGYSQLQHFLLGSDCGKSSLTGAKCLCSPSFSSWWPCLKFRVRLETSFWIGMVTRDILPLGWLLGANFPNELFFLPWKCWSDTKRTYFGNGMTLTILWQKPGKFPVQPHLSGGFPNPPCFLLAQAQHPWQASPLNPRHKARGYSKFPELPAAALKKPSKGDWSQGCSAKKAIGPWVFPLGVLGMLINAWHTKCHLKVFSGDIWNFAISKVFLVLEVVYFWSHLWYWTWNKM